MEHRPSGSFAAAGLQSGNGTDAVVLFRDHCVLEGCSGDAIYLSSAIDSEPVEGIYFPISAEVGEVFLSLLYANGLWVAELPARDGLFLHRRRVFARSQLMTSSVAGGARLF